jgi:hypothetical protein
VCWPVLWWVGRQPWAGRVQSAVSWILLVFGTAWLIERAFALRFMPV